MRCKVCSQEMAKRMGAYGEFWYCKNSTPTFNHGTVFNSSEEEMVTISLGEYKRLKRIEDAQLINSTGLQKNADTYEKVRLAQALELKEEYEREGKAWTFTSGMD